VANDGVGPMLELSTRRRREWMLSVIGLLDIAIGELDREPNPAKSTVLQAAALLREQVEPREEATVGGLLPWEARRVRDYIEAHLADVVHVEDLSLLIDCSLAHFSRSFKRTFGESPHAFVVKRRLEMAVRFMLETEMGLTDIAFQCGFADQSHFCRLFRNWIGATPATWRRAHRQPGAGLPEKRQERSVERDRCLSH
jgi:AraC family transcriptional regulator